MQLICLREAILLHQNIHILQVLHTMSEQRDLCLKQTDPCLDLSGFLDYVSYGGSRVQQLLLPQKGSHPGAPISLDITSQ